MLLVRLDKHTSGVSLVRWSRCAGGQWVISGGPLCLCSSARFWPFKEHDTQTRTIWILAPLTECFSLVVLPKCHIIPDLCQTAALPCSSCEMVAMLEPVAIYQHRNGLTQMSIRLIILKLLKIMWNWLIRRDLSPPLEPVSLQWICWGLWLCSQETTEFFKTVIPITEESCGSRGLLSQQLVQGTSHSRRFTELVLLQGETC